MTQASVRIVGADQALKALRTLEPLVAREVGRDVSNIGRELAASARSLAPDGPPVSGWVGTSGARGSRGGAGWPEWGPIQASYQRRGMSVRVTTSSSPPAIASLAESLGRGQRWRTEAGLRLVTYARLRWGPIVQSGKKEGRVARAAVASNYPQIMENLRKACDRAVEEVNRRMP
jgi:hypothetical protein